MDPVPLVTCFRENIPDGAPESQSSISCRELWCTHPALFEVPQELGPRLLCLPVAVGDGDQLLFAIRARADHHQAAQTVIAPKSHAGRDYFYPDVDVIPAGEIAPHEVLPLGLPLLGKTGHRRGREPSPGTEEFLQSREEAPTGEPVRVQQRQGTSVTFGDRRMQGGRITLLNLRLSPLSSTRRSLTLGARTSTAPAPRRTSRSLA